MITVTYFYQKACVWLLGTFASNFRDISLPLLCLVFDCFNRFKPIKNVFFCYVTVATFNIPVKRNLIHPAMSWKILSNRAKLEASCQDLDGQTFLDNEHLDKFLTRSYQDMSWNFLGETWKDLDHFWQINFLFLRHPKWGGGNMNRESIEKSAMTRQSRREISCDSKYWDLAVCEN